VLRQVERAEAAVRDLGFRELRVRHFDRLGLVEIAVAEMGRLSDPELRTAVIAGVRRAGYELAVIDPAGYRRGRLSEDEAGAWHWETGVPPGV
jgi:uncharacterized protein